MANVKISQLPSATTPLAGTEVLPIVQGTTTKKVTVNQLRGTTTPAVTAVTGTAPVVSSGGTTPAISMAAATGSVNGYLTSADWTTFNGKYSVGGALGTPSSGTATNLTGLPLTTGVTGILPVANGGNGTATPSLVAGTNVTISGSWPNQTINSTGGGGGGVTSFSAGSTGLTPATATTGAVTLAGTLAVASGGTGTATPSLVAGTNVSITGTWPNQTINSSGGGGGGMVYPGAGIPLSTGSAWGTSYNSTGTGDVVLSTSPTLVTPLLGTPTSGNFSTGSFTWPTFNQNTTGTAANVTGTVAIANGGTGQTTAAAAITALTGTQTAGQYLRSDGTNAALAAIQAADVPTLNQNTTGNAATATTATNVSGGTASVTTLSASGVATFSAGTAAAPAITTTGDTNTGIFFPAADTIAFSEGGAESVRIDSSGNVGIGTSSPAAKFDLAGDYKEGVVTANTSTAYTISTATGTIQILTLTGNCTFTYPTATAGESFTLLLRQDATGGRTATWPAAVKWPGNTPPTITSTASRQDKFVFTADGTNWYGSNAGQNYTV